MRRSSVLGFGFVVIALTSFTVQAQQIELVPISADGSHSIVGNEIILDGAGQRVWIEIFVSGWGPLELRTFQAKIDSTGYSSGTAGIIGPAVQACTTDADCVAALGTKSVCNVPPGAGTTCEAGFIDSDRADWVFTGKTAIVAVNLFDLNYTFGGSILFPPFMTDPGVAGYGGSLVLDIPAGAIGTFTVALNPADSFQKDPDGNDMTPITLGSVLVTVKCTSNADCDDGNACTNDSCDGGGSCLNVDNYNEATECCTPLDGTITPIDDGSECTTDTCDPLTGAVTHAALPTGTTCGNPASGECDAQDTCDGLGTCVDRFAAGGASCGNPADSECDAADTCDGSGACQANILPSGATCGDATDTDCNAADTCDGAGNCQGNLVPTGTSCGDPTNNECDDPDTCDGSGACLSNYENSGLPCGNPVGDQCDNPDSCDGAGVCAPNFVPSAAPCGDPSSSECDSPDTCDGSGGCAANNLPDDTLCSDDGNECRDDVCLAGDCTHPLTVSGTPCGDPTGAECDNADTCDGLGTCQTNLEPSGAACGDPTLTDCDRADACNGSGACLPNVEPQGTACGDNTARDCDDPDTCDGSGTCQTNVKPSGVPCGNQVGNQCDNPDSCDGSGVCEPNFVLVGSSCGNPANSECDNPDSCDGAGTCGTNHELDGTGCLDDGNDCRDDVCAGGVCSHPLSPPGNPCGDPTDADCNSADSCDGAGTCLPNLASSGAACGDPANTACTAPDGCNGLGSCLQNDAADGTDCDDGSFCNAGAVCVGGFCGGGTAVDCNDGLTCTVDSCNELDAQCDNILLAGSCLIDGDCYLDGEFNPANACEVCDVFLSTGTWSLMPAGSACNDGDPCTGTGEPGIGFDECDALGSCSGTVDPNCNDDCINAVEVFDGTNIGNNENRGPDDAEAICQPDSNNDVWYFYVATCTGVVLMDTDGSQFTPWNDTVLSVYDGCGSTEIACDDDDGPGLLSLLGFNAIGGQTYWIRVAGFDGNSGDLTLNIATVDGCVIDGACFADGEVNPLSDCESCNPFLSATTWSARPVGSVCGDPGENQCDSADACDGNGICETNNKGDFSVCADDGNECTSDVCLSGVCEHPFLSFGTVCGDPTVTGCDNADTCDGAGACQDNFTPPGVACGDSSTSECDNADVCDGFGACDDNHQPDGLSCGDDGIECTADVCDAGFCTHPDLAAGTSCGDSANTDCDHPDSCDGAGACLTNFEVGGAGCGDPGDFECDNPDTCNGIGTCVSNFDPIGFACGDPTDTDCDRSDSCDGSGLCRENIEPSGLPCGSPSNTQCDNPDTCDGSGACLVNFEPPGITCGDPGVTECDNADSCDGGGVCQTNNQADGLGCGNDGLECTFDQCDTGICEHPSRPVGTTCGDAADTECDNPDTCDGGTVCLSNREPSGTSCGDAGDSDCDHPDTCDGGGLCLTNFEPSNVACGDLTATDCNNPDTCNGSGACLDNFEIGGFPCGEPSNTQCDNPDTCDGSGDCLSNFEPTGLACGDSSTSECDNADICDGGGACSLNHVSDGTACSDDGNDCRDDVCQTGLCAHPPKLTGTSCGDAADTECDDPDTCDGGGVCLPNNEALGLACGDNADATCDHPDICDGSGSCDANFAPDGETCDDLDICTGSDDCQSGLCAGTAIAEAPLVVRIGSRYLSVTPLPAGSSAPVALRITSPDWSCIDQYIGASGLLTANPVVLLPDAWGTVNLRSDLLFPSSTYEVVAECGTHTSAPGSAMTSLWGDGVGAFDGAIWPPPDGNVDFDDITATVDAFRVVPTAPAIVRVDLYPCVPDQTIDFDDISSVVDAFKGLPIACPDPCP